MSCSVTTWQRRTFLGSLKWWLSGNCVDKWEQEGNALPSRHLSMWLTGAFIDLMRDKLHYTQSDCTDHPAAWRTFLLVLMNIIQPNCRMTVEWDPSITTSRGFWPECIDWPVGLLTCCLTSHKCQPSQNWQAESRTGCLPGWQDDSHHSEWILARTMLLFSFQTYSSWTQSPLEVLQASAGDWNLETWQSHLQTIVFNVLSLRGWRSQSSHPKAKWWKYNFTRMQWRFFLFYTRKQV